MEARGANGRPADAVARFHLNNGALLERIKFCGDTSPRGLRQSHGIMVNYLYDLDEIGRNHEAYASSRSVVASPQVRKMLAGDDPAARNRGWQSLLPPREPPSSSPKEPA